MKELKYFGYIITENAHSDFYACNGENSIHFKAEYKNGTYFKIINYYDMYTNRCYTAQRYLYKIIPLAREMTFELLKNGWLWDYKNQCPALETYKKDMLPYYNRCKENGIEISTFLESLYS